MGSRTDTIELRVMRLEQRQRRLLVTLGMVFTLVACMAMAPKTQILRAHAFELLAPDGSVAAEWITRDNHPRLHLKDANGTDRVAVYHAPDASGIYVNDTDGVTRIGVAQFAHGGGGVALHGPEGKGAAVLYLKREGSLRFFDATGVITTQVPVSRTK